MKYGAHCFIFTERWADSQLHLLDTSKGLGLDVFEIATGDDVSFSLTATRKAAEALGLELFVSPGGQWPTHCDLSSDDPQERQAGLAWHKRQVDIASELGASCYAGALYGHPGTIKRRAPSMNEWQWTAEGLHQLAEYAAANTVKVVLEPMSHFRTHLINTPEQVVRMIELVDHANVYALLDTYHLVTEIRDFAAGFHTAKDKLLTLHACGSDRGVPGGDIVPWQQVFRAIRESNWDGTIMFESYNSSQTFAYERGLFHNVCPDGAAFVAQGLRFIRQSLDAN